MRRYEDADALSVFKYREEIEGQPPAFLQCGGFVYPLVKGKSPILKSGERMYMFPELRGEGGCGSSEWGGGGVREDLFSSVGPKFLDYKCWSAYSRT